LSSAQILVLGAIAGATILLGLPLGRLATPSIRLKAALSAMATGILLFLLFDVLEGAVEPVDGALGSAVHHGGSWGRFSWYVTLFGLGIAAGLMSLVYYDGWMKRKRKRTMLGPGAASAAEFEQSWAASLSASAFLSLLIATGIGLHNFSEGLAIGQAGAQGEISLAIVLIVGFGLHNATEGFGIVAPLSGEPVKPSWRFLLLLGLIGGAPTFVGTLIGQAWASESLSILFLALAAGSILYVVLELANVNRRMASKEFVAWFVLLGLALGFATEFVVAAAGA
jgi:zinc transporter, ZIP family